MARTAIFTVILALALISFTQAALIERSNPTQTFCPAFRKECDNLIDSTNNSLQTVNTKSYCKRNGKKHSTNFTFYCKINGDDFTQEVLDNISNEDTTLQRRSRHIKSINVVIPAGIFADQRKRATHQGTFCSSYLNACQTECARVRSYQKHVVCRRRSTLHYTLACKCANGKLETQHALARTLNNPSNGGSSSTSSSSTSSSSSSTATTSSSSSSSASSSSSSLSSSSSSLSSTATSSSSLSTTTSAPTTGLPTSTNIISSVVSDVTSAVSSVLSKVTSDISGATSTVDSIVSKATSALSSLDNQATSALSSVVSQATGVVGGITAGVSIPVN